MERTDLKNKHMWEALRKGIVIRVWRNSLRGEIKSVFEARHHFVLFREDLHSKSISLIIHPPVYNPP